MPELGFEKIRQRGASPPGASQGRGFDAQYSCLRAFWILLATASRILHVRLPCSSANCNAAKQEASQQTLTWPVVVHGSSSSLTAYQVSNNLDLIAALVWSLINVLLWSLPLTYTIFHVPSPAPASKGRGGIGFYSLLCAFASLLLIWGFGILVLAIGQGIGPVRSNACLC